MDSFPVGSRVRLPNGQMGLIVERVTNVRVTVAWRSKNPPHQVIETDLLTHNLTLVSLPLPRMPRV